MFPVYAVRFDPVQLCWLRIAPVDCRPLGPGAAVPVLVDALHPVGAPAVRVRRVRFVHAPRLELVLRRRK